MTTNDERICQEALALLRQETRLTEGFSAGGDSLTKVESACCRTFDYARRAFLAAHDWNFARVRAPFAAAKPSGAIRVVDVTDADGETVRWRLDGQTITATGAAYTVYTGDAEDVAAWPALARAAFVAYLARELCIPVTGRQEDLKSIDSFATERMNAARLADLREGSPADDLSAEVLALLQQGNGLTGSTEADGVEAATRRLSLFIRSATDEVVAAHDWGADVTGYDTLPVLARGAVLALAAQKIAVRIGTGAEHANALHALYEARLQRARIRHLSDGLAKTGDTLQKEVLARLLGEFAEDEKALGFNVAAYTGRIDAVSATVLGAVNDAHDWGATYAANELDGTLREAYVLGVCAALAATVGVPAERAAAFRQAYEAKIVSARVKNLHDKLAANADPVLAELVANFRADDAGLVHLFDIYTARAAAVRGDAEAEVAASHDWPTLADEAEAERLASLRTAATNARILEKLSVAAGGGEASAQRYAREYAAKLLFARRYALEHEPLSGVAADVAALLRPLGGVPDEGLPSSLGARVAEMLPQARKEIMDAHRWNFARVSMPVHAEAGPSGECVVARPADCGRVEAVKRPDGGLAEWSMRGDWIVSHEPVGSITYIRDDEDVDAWPPAVRRALVCRIAAGMGLECAGRDAAALTRLYEKAMSDAALLDAREGNPGRSAWGRGRYVEAMRGGSPYWTRSRRHG